MTGCSEGWRAQSKWSMKSLLGMENGNKEWVTNHIPDSEENQSGQKTPLRGQTVLNMLANKKTIRIFDPLSVRSSTLARENNQPIPPTDKMELLDDYEVPKALPENLFSRCGILTDYQWSVLSSPNTGACTSQKVQIYPNI